MAHTHTHAEDQSDYYVEQLCTIGICGTMGAIAVMLYYSAVVAGGNGPKMLVLLVHENLYVWVLCGGIALLALAAIRAVAVWVAAGKMAQKHEHAHDHDHAHDCPHDHAHEHDHAHTEACGHEHGHDHAHAHEHDHGHEHGWAPWRYVVLLLPITLFFLGLPNKGPGGSTGVIKDDNQLKGVKAVKDQGDGVDFTVGFRELGNAGYTPEKRAFYEGKMVQLVGQFVPGPPNNRSFTLVRYKISCCAADAIPLPVIIMIDPASEKTLPQDIRRDQWVQVTGRVQFVEQPGKPGEYITLLMLKPSKEHPMGDWLDSTIPRPSNPYVF
jgi:hypothetical protein